MRKKTNFTKIEKELIDSSSRLVKKYLTILKGVKDSYFTTIKQYGSNKMTDLLDYKNDGLDMTRNFYIVLRGERKVKKIVILNDALTL